MKKAGILLLSLLMLSSYCQKKDKDLYTIGIFQVNDAPTLNLVRKAFIETLKDKGLREGEDVRLITKNAYGDIPEVQRIAQEFVDNQVDMIVALSTPCLQSALHVTSEIPVVFSSVANPYLAGAGKSAEDHLKNVTGVSSRGPIKETLNFIKKVLPKARRVGTLWTPSELNSKYYLELAQKKAEALNLEILDVPIANSSQVLLFAQRLINKKVDVIFPISDNTINASFEAISRVAEENNLPLFGGFLLSTQLGACAALGWDFYEMGTKAGQLAWRVKEGENPGDIPFQYMHDVRLHINLKAAEKQGIQFSSEILDKADKVIGRETKPVKDTPE
ncbi:ABC transporter substrate-binding protein [bacterium]|nr:ABC transporter substrate-binding protein [bacterium]